VNTTKNASRQRRAVARARVKSAARDLNHAVVDAGTRIVRAHPWAAASAGFCVGFAAPFLFRSRRDDALVVETFAENDGLRSVWSRARSAAVEAFACAVAVSVDHLLARAVERTGDDCQS
jgi:hypothetical protein